MNQKEISYLYIYLKNEKEYVTTNKDLAYKRADDINKVVCRPIV